MRRIVMTAGLGILLTLAGCPSGGESGGGTGGGGTGSATCADVSGTWSLDIQEDGTQCPWSGGVSHVQHTLVVTQSACDLTVDVTDIQGAVFQGKVDGSQVTWTGTAQVPSMSLTVTRSSLTVSGDRMSGTVVFSVTASGGSPCPVTWTLTGQRQTGGGGGGGGGGDGGSGGGGTQLGVAQLAVGAWYATGTCQGYSMEYGWYLCPGGLLSGFEKLDGYGFLDCGSWSVASAASVSASVTSTATADGSTGHNTYTVGYDAAADQLDIQGTCSLTFQRLTGGAVTAADCTNATCGSGAPAQCGTDCDCGRCWYCDQGTCAYGGEGPYGCYRGCGG